MQFMGCRANQIKTLSNYWGGNRKSSHIREKDVEKFAKLYEIEEEKVHLTFEEWVKNPPTVYLNMTVGEIEKLTGKTILQNSFQIVFSFVGYFSTIYLEDSSFYFLCEG